MNVADINAASIRDTTDGTRIEPMFTSRWSPRAMSGDGITRSELITLLEAARWAPSCFNAQPWRFGWALRDTPAWQPLFETLVEGNQAWAKRAAALIAVISRREFEHNDKPAPTHAFDSGAAWMSLALQCGRMGLVAHGMRGFDPDQLRANLRVPDLYEVQAVIAIGHPGNVDDLPESYRERETPSARKPLAEISFEGSFEGLER